VSQQGCSGLLTSIDLAARMLATSPRRAVLCVAGDSLPPRSTREVMYNLMSDAAAALLVEKGATRNRIVHVTQRVHPYYWDSPARQEELMASYFPIAQRTIIECLDEAGLAFSDVRWLVPHNVSKRSWEILARLVDFPEDRIWTKNIARVGHTVSCDHVVNLVDMTAEGALEKGDKLLLFTFGFGASWSCLILEH
jgi:3-oxoacyl-[acyl-carrier-protein] synthase-3